VRVEPGTVRIAVNSVAAKLSVPFLEVCSELARRSERAIEFHFFAGLPPVSTSHLTERLRPVLPSLVVHPWSDFGTYLERLSACDLQLATFPFGGTNTVGDSLAAGLPVVTMRGPEPHSTVDAAMVGMVGLPEWMVATDSEEYLAAAQRLLADDAQRVRLSETLLQQDLSEAFHDPAYHNHSCDFAAVVRWLLRYHDEVRLSEKKVWRAEDRERIDSPAIASPA
jgi:glycosyltransferase involved in cell wall biosynthesis